MTAFADDPMLAHLTTQTDALLSTIATLDDAAVRAPSGLPGWSRAHVLSHVARNADAFGNLVRSASTGVMTPMYPSAQQRDADIEAGSGRPVAELEADVESSAERLLALLAEAPGQALDRDVPTGRGTTVRLSDLTWLRTREVTYHHVDLDVGFGFADLPDDLVRRGLQECADRMSAADPGVTADARYPDGTVETVTLGNGAVAVSGAASDVLAWFTGRSLGDGVQAADGRLPNLPAWG